MLHILSQTSSKDTWQSFAVTELVHKPCVTKHCLRKINSIRFSRPRAGFGSMAPLTRAQIRVQLVLSRSSVVTPSRSPAGSDPSGARPRSERWAPSWASEGRGSTAACTRARPAGGGGSAANGPAPLRAGGGGQQAEDGRVEAAAPALPALTALRAADKRPAPAPHRPRRAPR